ncbi:MAG: hypothetical protein CMK71_02690 [Pseudomonadaceae bacterium]|nr:hypothetical protein [Pseudomonadaceae bacterium]
MRTGLIVLMVFWMAGCSPTPPKTPSYLEVTRPHSFKPTPYDYEAGKSPAWNFQARLSSLTFSCGLEASSGFSIARMGLNDQAAIYNSALSECFKYARAESDQAIATFKQGNPSPKIMDLGKDLYAKWSAYMSTMSVYSPENRNAKTEYATAQSALLAEEKF